MANFLPTSTALIDLAHLLGLEPNDPVVVVAFDELVLRGHLRPWLAGGDSARSWRRGRWRESPLLILWRGLSWCRFSGARW